MPELSMKEMPEKFRVTEQVDLKDYLYDGDAMRSLSGKGCHCGIGRIDVHIGSAGGKAEA